MNRSKILSPRFWKKWAGSGAVEAAVFALCMKEPKRRLTYLREYMPSVQEEVLAFGGYVAGYLNPKLLPEGFVLGCEMALYDLQKGVNGFTGKRIQSSLVGYPPMIYRVLRAYIPLIADAVCPPGFAAGVRTFISGAKKVSASGTNPKGEI